MSKHDNGGPAFPTGQNANPNNPHPDRDNGMSLLDWYAGRATSEVSDECPDWVEEIHDMPEQPPTDDLKAWSQWWAMADARHRYMQAEEMIAEKRRREEAGG